MASVDSEAVFTALLVKLGLSDYLLKFHENGWTSHGAFAFAANYRPGAPDDGPLRDEVVAKLTGDRTHPILASIRRLHFESWQQYSQEAKRAVERKHDAAPREMPAPERKARLDNLREALPSTTIEDDLVPSDLLVDEYQDMQESGTLLYIPWSALGRRDLEMQLGKKKRDPFFQPNSEGFLCAQSQPVEAPTDLSTTLKLSKALQRRGFAMHMAGLMSYKVHEQVQGWLLRELEREALPGFHQVTLEQVELTDKQFFMLLAERSRGSLAPNPFDGSMPLDCLVEGVMREHRIGMILTQTKIALPSHNGGTKRPFDDGNHAAAMQKLQRKNAELQLALSRGGGKQTGKGKSAGKGNDKKKKKRGAEDGNKKQPMPKELEGLESSYKGQRICFGFNMQGGCKGVVKDGRCEKGLHVCARAGCHGHNHGANNRDCPGR